MDQDMEEENEENERENKQDVIRWLRACNDGLFPCCFSTIKSTFRTICVLQIAECTVWNPQKLTDMLFF